MKCPNCSGEIGRFELSPNCKHCGANIFYVQQKTLLSRDAKRCELEYAVFRILVAKLKAAFIRGPVPVLRIVSMILAIGAIFVPFATVTADIPLISAEFSFGAWGVYSAFSDGTLEALLNMKEYIPVQVVACLSLLALMVLIFLVGFSIFLCLILSFTNLRKTAKVMRGLSVAGGILCAVAAVLSLMLTSIFESTSFLTASWGVGAFACILVFVLIFVLNHIFIKKNFQPDIKEVDIKRVELSKKVKSGEVSLDDLSLPVFETDEENQKCSEKEDGDRVE